MGLSGLRTGTEYLKAPASKGSRNFTPFISWKDGESRTILFTTPIEGVAKVRLHDWVKIPHQKNPDNPLDKGFHWDHFMCRKDPAWLSESGGECYLCDVIGHKASEKHTAVGIELEPVHATGGPMVTGLNIITRSYKREDGTEVSYPQWGLIRQSFSNFYNYFTAFGQKWGGINHAAFDVSRIGGDKNTSYVIMPLMGIDLPDLTAYAENIPTLLEVLEPMGSVEKYDTLKGQKIEVNEFDDDSNTFTPASQTGVGMETKFEQLKKALPEQFQDKVESFSGA